jgi:hypothetical protein
MYGCKDEAGNFRSYEDFTPWQYGLADWIVEPGLIAHHIRIIQCFLDDNSVRWYLIFDTTLEDGHGDYKWRRANELESKSRLYKRPDPGQIPAILERASLCRYVDYSIFARTDCESIQGWIQTGNETDRWSSQVWIGIGAAVGSLLLASAQPTPKSRQRRQSHRHRP